MNEAAARSSSTKRRCGPRASSSPRTSIVATKFLKDHPDQVAALIKATRGLHRPDQERPGRGEADSSPTASTKITGKPLPIPIVTSSFENHHFTLDPIPSSLQKDAKDAKAVGLIDSSDLDGHLRSDVAERAALEDRARTRSRREAASHDDVRIASSPVRPTGLEASARPGRLDRQRHQGLRHRESAASSRSTA